MNTGHKPNHLAPPGGARDPDAPVEEDFGSVVWTDARLLGYGPIDETHREFYLVAFDLLRCTDSNVGEALAAFEVHALEHFGQEQQWMEDTNFEGAQCHIEEHDAVLASVREVREGVAARRLQVAVVHSLAEHLFRWFPGHADHMDSALAAWMSRRQYGGQPLVFRRRA